MLHLYQPGHKLHVTLNQHCQPDGIKNQNQINPRYQSVVINPNSHNIDNQINKFVKQFGVFQINSPESVVCVCVSEGLLA